MKLSDYPRPPGDTGIGVRWSAGPGAVDMHVVRASWLPVLKAMGVKWVQIDSHEGTEELSGYLLARGIMPVVRLSRNPPNPGQLNVGQVAGMMRHLRAGARYFECNHEPNLGSAWEGGEVPGDGPEVVTGNWIRDAEVILNAGGLAGTPALAPGDPAECERWNWLRLLAERSRLDLLEAGAWIAVQHAARASGAGEGGYREVEYWDALARQYLGHSLPVLAAEASVLAADAVRAAAAKYMMDDAPEYYFCYCYAPPAVEALKQLPKHPRRPAAGTRTKQEVFAMDPKATAQRPDSRRAASVPPASAWRLAASHNAESAADATSRDGLSAWCCGDRQEPNMWFSIDLGQPTAVSRVIAHSPPDTAPRGFVLQVSKDGKNWEPVARRDDNWLPVDETFAPVMARYVGITLTAESKHAPWCISGIEIE